MANPIKIKRSNTPGAVPSSLLDGEICINQADKILFYRNSAGVVQSFNLAGASPSSRTVLTVGSAFASTVVNRVSVTGMSFAVTAGKKYEIKLIGSYQSVALTTGGSIGFVLTSGTGNILGFVTMSISQTSAASDLSTTIRAISSSNTLAGSFMTSTGVTVINSPHYFNGELIFDCLTTGVLELQFATEVAASSAQINAGAVMIVDVLN